MPTVLAHSGAEADKSSVVECMDWQSDGTMLATGSMDGWIRVWNKSGVFHLLLTALPVTFCLPAHTLLLSLYPATSLHACHLAKPLASALIAPLPLSYMPLPSFIVSHALACLPTTITCKSTRRRLVQAWCLPNCPISGNDAVPSS
jgi:WD40 repeat protein